MAAQIKKWLERTELQVVALVLVLVLCNHFLKWGLGLEELLAMAGVSSAYAISRGVRKHGSARAPSGFVLTEVLLGLVGLALLVLALAVHW